MPFSHVLSPSLPTENLKLLREQCRSLLQGLSDGPGVVDAELFMERLRNGNDGDDEPNMGLSQARSASLMGDRIDQTKDYAAGRCKRTNGETEKNMVCAVYVKGVSSYRRPYFPNG
ncbi:hypothetical protein NLG97_g9205 [Lecanicillium saksenae]|uniref:Uncharacterized protein n=1 Tax=Lecanicillium saksenae TaxID=468837 RepID=A0ACC1QGW8_9HYPO|nr:hypothetical protein NLG97_g9205 [Lecanicillium saksenae]